MLAYSRTDMGRNKASRLDRDGYIIYSQRHTFRNVDTDIERLTNSK